MAHIPRGKYDARKRRPGGPYHPTPEEEKRIEAAIAQSDAELAARKNQDSSKQSSSAQVANQPKEMQNDDKAS